MVAGQEIARIGPGLCVLVGVTHDDDDDVARRMADKVVHLRVLDDEDGMMNRSVADVGAEILVVSQFTLYGDTSGGRRPSWIAAARPEQAEPLVEAVVDELRRLGASVATGRFRAEILAPGGSRDPRESVRSLLGREPTIEPLLRRRGIG